MANLIIQNFLYFRQKITSIFSHSKEALVNLIDAIAATKTSDSVVKLSLSGLFPRHHTSIFQAINDLFRQSEQAEVKKSQLTGFFCEQCPEPIQRCFYLFGTDCTSHPRVFAKKLADRTMVHAPNKVAGPPVTIGHEYSVVAYLPEKGIKCGSTWIHPLSVERVKSNEVGTAVGLKQLSSILKEDRFRGCFCVNVADAAYSAASYIKGAEKIEDGVQIVRLRGNRVLNRSLPEIEEECKKGRPKRYGEVLRLKKPTAADEKIKIEREWTKGRKVTLEIERWNNILVRGKEQCAPIDVVRVQIRTEEGKVYPKPLWLAIVGKRRGEINLIEIYDVYAQRYDLEHFFRFSKQNLLMDRFQTPEVKHEENWWWLGFIAYTMLSMARGLSKEIVHPWEKEHNRKNEGTEKTPSQVQRDYERIIREIGAEASMPKRRGKSPGRLKGQVVKRRPRQQVIKKSKKLKKVA